MGAQHRRAGSACELVLVDRTRKRAKAVAIDVRSGAPLAPRVDIRDGDYEEPPGWPEPCASRH